MGVLAVTGCRAHSAVIFKPLLPEILQAQSLAVASAEDRSWGYVEEVLVQRMRRCRPGFRATEISFADLRITWEPVDPWICLDYWDSRCDAKAARATVTTESGKSVQWERPRPTWCGVPDCLLQLFARDLSKAVCAGGPPSSSALSEILDATSNARSRRDSGLHSGPLWLCGPEQVAVCPRMT